MIIVVSIRLQCVYLLSLAPRLVARCSALAPTIVSDASANLARPRYLVFSPSILDVIASSTVNSQVQFQPRLSFFFLEDMDHRLTQFGII